MSDDTSLRSAQDRTHVAMDQEHEVRYWTERFGVSREDLQRAVDDVGNSVSAMAATQTLREEIVRDKAEREKLDRRHAHEIEENQEALRRSIEETQRLLSDSDQMLRRHRKEREEHEPDEG